MIRKDVALLVGLQVLAGACQVPDETSATWTVAPRQLPLSVERTLGAAAHEYRLVLRAGDFLDVEVAQLGRDVALHLLAADGTSLARVDSPNGSWGPERLWWVAPAGGAAVDPAFDVARRSLGALRLGVLRD